MVKIENLHNNHLTLVVDGHNETLKYSDIIYCKFVGGFTLNPGIKLVTKQKTIIAQYEVDKKLKDSVGYSAIAISFNMFTIFDKKSMLLKQLPVFDHLMILESKRVKVKKPFFQAYDIEAAYLPLWRQFSLVMLNAFEFIAMFILLLRLPAMLLQGIDTQDRREVLVLSVIASYLLVRYAIYFKTGYRDEWKVLRVLIPSLLTFIAFSILFLFAILTNL